MHAAKWRAWQMKLFVKGKHDRGNGVNVLLIDGRSVIRADQLNVIARFSQAASQLAQRPRYAVDLGKIGFGDERDTHESG